MFTHFNSQDDLIRVKSNKTEKGQSFMSIRNYYSRQRSHRKNLSWPFVSKSNLRVINIFGREFLNYGSAWKTLSKLQRPETGRASAWELNDDIFNSFKNYFKFCAEALKRWVLELCSRFGDIFFWVSLAFKWPLFGSL